MPRAAGPCCLASVVRVLPKSHPPGGRVMELCRSEHWKRRSELRLVSPASEAALLSEQRC